MMSSLFQRDFKLCIESFDNSDYRLCALATYLDTGFVYTLAVYQTVQYQGKSTSALQRDDEPIQHWKASFGYVKPHPPIEEQYGVSFLLAIVPISNREHDQPQKY
ncbi:hypothetical protein CWC12_00645 [Pseudoalteromonas ruthenica]|nr:hypothetical protein CWC12_00645 [Pseudoalteromonas ruthenica]TMP23604.1 hypothetical protein CWC06_10210 [Pseudoalteromonas ruthenica]